MIVFLGNFFKNIVACAVAGFRFFAPFELKFVEQNFGKLFRRIGVKNSSGSLIDLPGQFIYFSYEFGFQSGCFLQINFYSVLLHCPDDFKVRHLDLVYQK